MSNTKEPGQASFEAYTNHGENAGKTYDGKSIPPWCELADFTKARWAASEQAAVRSRLDGLGNDRPGIKDAFARAHKRYDDECFLHSAPLSLRVLFDCLEDELRKSDLSVGASSAR